MITKYYKAIIALVGVVGTTLATIATDPDISGVLPTTAGQWTASAAGVLLTTVLTWLVRNQPTVEEAEKILTDAQARGKHEK